jgi:hypothetical protein
VPATPPPIQVAPTQAASYVLIRVYPAASPWIKLDLLGDSGSISAEFRLLGEQLAHVDTGTDNPMITRPGTQHPPEPLPD